MNCYYKGVDGRKRKQRDDERRMMLQWLGSGAWGDETGLPRYLWSDGTSKVISNPAPNTAVSSQRHQSAEILSWLLYCTYHHPPWL